MATKESLLEKARREWKEGAAARQKASPTPPHPEEPSPQPAPQPHTTQTVNPLTLSSALKLQQNLKIPEKLYEEDIKKTILVSNLPIEDETLELQLRILFSSFHSGIHAIRFYPKGSSQSALVQFNEPHKIKSQAKYAVIGNNHIDVQPSKISIQQYQNAKYSNFDELLKKKQQELVQAKSQNPGHNEIAHLQNIIKDKDATIVTLQQIIQRMGSEITTLEEKLRAMGNASPPVSISPARAPVVTPTTTTTTTTTSTTKPHQHPTQSKPPTVQEKPKVTNETENLSFLLSLIEEEKKKESQKSSQTYLCPICFNDYPISNICVLDSCFHRFCKECIEEWIKTKVNDKEVTVITCPDNRCLKQITYNEVCSILTDKNLLAKYEKFTLEKSLETIPDLRWCPRPGCGNAMIGGKKTLMMRCTNPSCLFCFCFNCKEEWHADATCTQYQQWKKDNASGTDRAKLWIQQHTKACPSCHVAIEKNGGCNHMTCRGCHYEFCWICMGRYTSGHFGDAYSSGSCPQYS